MLEDCNASLFHVHGIWSIPELCIIKFYRLDSAKSCWCHFSEGSHEMAKLYNSKMNFKTVCRVKGCEKLGVKHIRMMVWGCWVLH